MQCRLSRSVKQLAAAAQRQSAEQFSTVQAACAARPHAAEAAEPEADEDDRREMLEVAEFMKNMRASR